MDDKTTKAASERSKALAAALSPLLEALDRSVAREVCGERLFR